MKEKFETSIYFGWFSENRTRQDQQNGVAYGQRNNITAWSKQPFNVFQGFSQNAIFYKSDILTIVIRVRRPYSPGSNPPLFE